MATAAPQQHHRGTQGVTREESTKKQEVRPSGGESKSHRGVDRPNPPPQAPPKASKGKGKGNELPAWVIQKITERKKLMARKKRRRGRAERRRAKKEAEEEAARAEADGKDIRPSTTPSGDDEGETEHEGKDSTDICVERNDDRSEGMTTEKKLVARKQRRRGRAERPRAKKEAEEEEARAEAGGKDIRPSTTWSDDDEGETEHEGKGSTDICVERNDDKSEGTTT